MNDEIISILSYYKDEPEWTYEFNQVSDKSRVSDTEELIVSFFDALKLVNIVGEISSVNIITDELGDEEYLYEKLAGEVPDQAVEIALARADLLEIAVYSNVSAEILSGEPYTIKDGLFISYYSALSFKDYPVPQLCITSFSANFSKGNMPPEIYKLNAPRLEQFLKQMESKLLLKCTHYTYGLEDHYKVP